MQNNPANDNYQEVVDFLSRELCVSKEDLSPCSKIFHDLGVDGADAVDLINKYSEIFNVDISGFPCSEYFGDEGTASPFKLIARFLMGQRTIDEMKPLTVGDLAEGIKLKRLKPGS